MSEQEVDLSEFQETMDEAEQVLETEFQDSIVPEGKNQQLYLEDSRVSDNFGDGIKRLILDIKGAQPDNQGKDATQMFRLMKDPERMKYLVKFVRKLGFNDPINMKTFPKDIKTLNGTVFEANVTHSVGTDRTFVNVYPNRVVCEAEAGEADSVLPADDKTPF